MNQGEYIIYNCPTVNDVLWRIRFTIDQYLETDQEIRSCMRIPTRLIGDLIAFKNSLPNLLDVFKEIVFDCDEDETELEFCKFSESYIGQKKFFLNLFFEYVDESKEILEIYAVAYYNEYLTDCSEDETEGEEDDD